MSFFGSIWNGIKGIGKGIVSAFTGNNAQNYWTGLSGLGSAALNYIGSAQGVRDQYHYNRLLQEQSYVYNKDLQATSQQWASGMAATAHQLEVNDLRKAGLNPILSATGGSGASAPSASGGSVGAGSVGLPDYDLSSGISTAMAWRQQKNLNEVSDAQVWNQRKQADLFGEQSRNEGQRYQSIIQDRENARNLVNKQIQDIDNQIKNRDISTAAQVERLRTQNVTDYINAYTNQKVGSANAYYNTHRALGYSDSWSDPGLGYNIGFGQVHFGQNFRGISHSRSW